MLQWNLISARLHLQAETATALLDLLGDGRHLVLEWRCLKLCEVGLSDAEHRTVATVVQIGASWVGRDDAIGVTAHAILPAEMDDESFLGFTSGTKR